MAKPVKIKPISSVTKDLAPTDSQLGTAEIAVNIHGDSPTLYVKDADDSVVVLADANRLANQAMQAAIQAGSSAGSKVASVGATAPVTSTGGLNPNIGITAATQSDPGSLSAGDKTKLDNLSTTYVAVAGDTMTGPLVLPADPTLDLQAATKQYVDSNIDSEDFWDRVGVTDVIKTRFSADDVSIGVSDQILLESSGAATFKGDVVIGDNKITMVASTGYAEFASNVLIGGEPASGANNGVRLDATGTFSASAASGSSAVFYGYTTGTSTATSVIKADGSATFADTLLVGENTATFGNEQIACVGDSSGTSGLFIHNKDGSTNSSADLWFGNWSGATTTGTYGAHISAINTNNNNASTSLSFEVYDGTSHVEALLINSTGSARFVGTGVFGSTGSLYTSDTVLQVTNGDNAKLTLNAPTYGSWSIGTGNDTGTDFVVRNESAAVDALSIDFNSYDATFTGGITTVMDLNTNHPSNARFGRMNWAGARWTDTSGNNLIQLSADGGGSITAAGSATFAGILGVTGKSGTDTAFYIWDAGNSNATTTSITAAGTASFVNSANAANSATYINGASTDALQVVTAGTTKVLVKMDGAATFAGGSGVVGGSTLNVGNGTANFIVNDGYGTGTIAGSALIMKKSDDTPTFTVTSDDGSITAAGTITAANNRIKLGATYIADPANSRGILFGYDAVLPCDGNGNLSNGSYDLGTDQNRFDKGYFSGSITAGGQVVVNDATAGTAYTVIGGRTLYGYNGANPNVQKYTIDAQTGAATFASNITTQVSGTSSFCAIAPDGTTSFIRYGAAFVRVNQAPSTQYCLEGGVNSGTNTWAITSAGDISGNSKSFRIPHPLPSKKDTHELVHSSIEGPQADLIYRGQVVLVDGKAAVNIDTTVRMTEGTFEMLCTNVSCFTSNETDWHPVKGSVSGNVLTIESQDATCTATVSWLIVGERKDQNIIDSDSTDENGRLITEPLKPVEVAAEEAGASTIL